MASTTGANHRAERPKPEAPRQVGVQAASQLKVSKLRLHFYYDIHMSVHYKTVSRFWRGVGIGRPKGGCILALVVGGLRSGEALHQNSISGTITQVLLG